MDTKAKELATYILNRFNQIPSSSRLIVGLCGIPASGKSTLAKLIVDYTNALSNDDNNSEPQAILVGLDGWHLTRAQLDAFPDPKLAHDRRGIHWSFDALAYTSFVLSLRQDIASGSILTAPSFDHALKDPTPAAIAIHPYHRIVLIEGLYTLLSIEPWRRAGQLLDERWFLQVDVAQATDRLVKRHVSSGVARDLDDAIWRATENDMPNGQFVIENMLEPTVTIESIQDPVFIPC